MAQNSIEGIFEAISRLKVLVIGDVMVDRYSHGIVNRVSPEAPVPIVSVTKTENRLGGAANVALNVQAMGADPILCGVIGDDQGGEDFVALLKHQNLNSKGIIRSAGRTTTIKHRILSGSQHLLRVDTEEDKCLEHLDKKTLISHIEQLIAEVDLIIFEDYDKGVLDTEIISLAIGKAKKKGIPTVVDPKLRNFFAYQGASLFKPNLRELEAGLGTSVEPEEETLRSSVGRLLEKMHVENVLITLSRKGVYYHNDSEVGLFPAHDRAIADISGAGDTVISLAALAHCIGLPLPFIAEFANLGGGIVCEHLGVVAIDPLRLLEEATDSSILQRYLAV